jgi:CBS domain-containing protein
MANEHDAQSQEFKGSPHRPAQAVSDSGYTRPDGWSEDNWPGHPEVTILAIMISKVAVVGPDVTLRAAMEHMKQSGTSFLLISDIAQFAGVLSDRDITEWLAAGGADIAPAREVMKPGVDVCYADQDVSEVARLMRVRGVSWLVVLDRNGRPAGVVTLADLVASGGNDALSGESIEGSSGITPRWEKP